MQNLFRAIPSVDASLAALHRADAALADSQQTPHALLRDLVTAFWDQQRQAIREGQFVADVQHLMAAGDDELRRLYESRDIEK